jgi:hypothetical protein
MRSPNQACQEERAVWEHDAEGDHNHRTQSRCTRL